MNYYYFDRLLVVVIQKQQPPPPPNKKRNLRRSRGIDITSEVSIRHWTGNLFRCSTEVLPNCNIPKNYDPQCSTKLPLFSYNLRVTIYQFYDIDVPKVE